jgi:hypothetical protein
MLTLLSRFARHAVVDFCDQIHLRLSCPPFLVQRQIQCERHKSPGRVYAPDDRTLKKVTKFDYIVYRTAYLFCIAAEVGGGTIYHTDANPGVGHCPCTRGKRRTRYGTNWDRQNTGFPDSTD